MEITKARLGIKATIPGRGPADGGQAISIVRFARSWRGPYSPDPAGEPRVFLNPRSAQSGAAQCICASPRRAPTHCERRPHQRAHAGLALQGRAEAFPLARLILAARASPSI